MSRSEVEGSRLWALDFQLFLNSLDGIPHFLDDVLKLRAGYAEVLAPVAHDVVIVHVDLTPVGLDTPQHHSSMPKNPAG
jgi:hypothetical protein